MRERVDHLELLRKVRRSAADRRKTILALYGLLILVLASMAVIASGRAAQHGDWMGQFKTTFLTPLLATREFFETAFRLGQWSAMALVLLGIWLVATLVGSFFGLAVTRMVAVQITCDRRPEVGEALRFARSHWFWAFVTPTSLLFAALALLGVAALFLWLAASIWQPLMVAAIPITLFLASGAAFMLIGLLAGGILAGPTIATEWSDAFDAITRIYGYGFTHTYRLFAYRGAGLLVLLVAAGARIFRAVLVFGFGYIVLLAVLGASHTRELFDAFLLEPPSGVERAPSDQIVGWTVLFCGGAYLSAIVARLLVYALALRQVIYLRLRLHIDKVPLDNIDGYRPDDSAFDPTAQGFELVEVEEEIRAE
ncbi:MAG: hypothetical protein V3T86_12455 [Planctomycetota bacterium]